MSDVLAVDKASNPPEPIELRALNEHIAAARRARGLRQGELARRCGLSQAAVSAIESGRRRPSLEQFFRLARALDVPVQQLIDGRDRPGEDLPDIALQLQSLGVADLWVRDAKVPGAFLWTEEVIALAASGHEPDPRVLLALPAVLAWNPWDAGSLRAFSRSHDALRLLAYRLAWLSDIALTIDRRRGFPGDCLREQLTRFIRYVPRPKRATWDSLGRPKAGEPRSPVWRRWKINFDAEIADFEGRATRLVEIGGGVRR